MGADREHEIDELLAERAITKVIHRYAQAADRGDHSLLESCFWPDATMDAGIFDGPAKILVDAVRSGPVDPTSVSKHFVGNVTVEVNLSEHVARAECYCFGGSRSQTSDGTTVERTTHVRYVDRFEERSGEWRIRRRVVAYDWSTTPHVTGENLMQPGFLTGKRGQDDIWHHILD